MNEQKPIFNRKKNIFKTLISFMIIFLPAYILLNYIFENGPIGAIIAIIPVTIISMLLFVFLISLLDKFFK